MPLATATRFDYAVLDAETSASLRSCAKDLEGLVANAATNLWNMGKILAHAQSKLARYGKGTFQRWVADEAGLKSITMAYRLINVYKTFDYAKLAQTTVQTSALYLLAAPSTPAGVRERAMVRAEQGEHITWTAAQEMVTASRAPPPPVRPPPPDPEYREFERTELRPYLHDAGVPDAPQMLSGACDEMEEVPDEQVEQARGNMRAAIIEQLVACRDGADVEACADEVMEVLGESRNTISTAARFGASLAKSPQTLSDLTAITIWANGGCLDGMPRDEYLRWRKRTLRTLDAISFECGLPLYQHRLSSGQLCYSLLEETAP